MTLKKKHYDLIARCIYSAVQDNRTNNGNDQNGQRILGTLITRMMSELERDNTRFNREKFIEACYGVAHDSYNGHTIAR